MCNNTYFQRFCAGQYSRSKFHHKIGNCKRKRLCCRRRAHETGRLAGFVVKGVRDQRKNGEVWHPLTPNGNLQITIFLHSF